MSDQNNAYRLPKANVDWKKWERIWNAESGRHAWVTELKKRNRWKRKMRGRHK